VVPALQNAGDVHATMEAAVAQTKPTGHCIVLTVEPAGQYMPRLHVPLHAAVDSRAAVPNVPGGQSVGAEAAAGQYEPLGQSMGVMVPMVPPMGAAGQ
jgi:hypothetical protein